MNTKKLIKYLILFSALLLRPLIYKGITRDNIDSYFIHASILLRFFLKDYYQTDRFIKYITSPALFGLMIFHYRGPLNIDFWLTAIGVFIASFLFFSMMEHRNNLQP